MFNTHTHTLDLSLCILHFVLLFCLHFLFLVLNYCRIICNQLHRQFNLYNLVFSCLCVCAEWFHCFVSISFVIDFAAMVLQFLTLIVSFLLIERKSYEIFQFRVFHLENKWYDCFSWFWIVFEFGFVISMFAKCPNCHLIKSSHCKNECRKAAGQNGKAYPWTHFICVIWTGYIAVKRRKKRVPLKEKCKRTFSYKNKS